MIFQQIHDLDKAWPYVEKGLQRIKEKSPVRWIDQEVYSAIYRGRAALFIGFDGDTPRGFIVTEIRRDDMSGRPYMNVWLLWAEGQTGNHADVKAFIPETVTFLDAHAKQMQVNRITLEGRKGWERFLAGYFDPIKVIYERNVA